MGASLRSSSFGERYNLSELFPYFIWVASKFCGDILVESQNGTVDLVGRDQDGDNWWYESWVSIHQLDLGFFVGRRYQTYQIL
jgi:hypothetical protein